MNAPCLPAHPQDVLFDEGPLPALIPVCDHYCGVEARMRKSLQLQAEMTLATLRRCVRRGLMAEAEALAVARQLQLLAPVPAAPSSSQTVPASAGW